MNGKLIIIRSHDIAGRTFPISRYPHASATVLMHVYVEPLPDISAHLEPLPDISVSNMHLQNCIPTVSTKLSSPALSTFSRSKCWSLHHHIWRYTITVIKREIFNAASGHFRFCTATLCLSDQPGVRNLSQKSKHLQQTLPLNLFYISHYLNVFSFLLLRYFPSSFHLSSFLFSFFFFSLARLFVYCYHKYTKFG